MRRFLFTAVAVMGAALAGSAIAPVAQAASTGLTAAQTGQIVSTEPARTTPNILDGTVYSLTTVGNQIVVGGSFTQVQNAGSTTTLTRNHLFAFDATTGKVSTTFAPEPNGVVYKVQAAADGSSVYIGGLFSGMSSGKVNNLFEADATTGALTPGFAPSTLDGQVRDIEVVGSRLWIGGRFKHIGTTAQTALGTVNATTGLYDPYFRGVLAGVHNSAVAGATTSVEQISTNPANTALVAVGSFMTVNGQSRAQIVKLDISGAGYALSPWNTTLFTQACSAKFMTNMTDVEYAPNGGYFVVSTTGSYGAGSTSGTSGCDVVARFENGVSSVSKPTWTAYTGGDTTWTVEVTENVIYAGGHQRWQNNPAGSNQAGQGAVDRPGIAALNPRNGMPYSWNPTRTRGVGVQDLLATSQGLYVGSDTDVFGATAGNTHHGRIAFVPLATGKTLPPMTTPTMPADLYTVTVGGSQLVRRAFSGTSVTATGNAANGTGWTTSVGAFMANGNLYTAYTNGTLTKRTFDGTTYGPATTVETADALVRQTDWHTTDVPSLTSLFYYNGRIYYTRSGLNTLYSRAFEVESDIVGQQRFSSPGLTNIRYSVMRGALFAGGKIYFSNTSGQFYRANWTGTGPVTGGTVQLSGPGKDAQNWASRAMFVYQGAPVPPDRAPTAAATLSCNGLDCSFDGSGSSDPDGTVAAYDWDFGDSSPHASGATTTHTYASGGDRAVTLTVTDDQGATGQTARTANPADAASPIGYVDATATGGNRTDHSVTVPTGVQAGDTLLLFFTANNAGATYTGPDGWTQVETATGQGIVERLYTRTAIAGDAGTSVAVASDVFVKSDTTVAAYRGTSAGSPVAGSAVDVDDLPGAAHLSPSVSAADGSSWLVTYWADKSTATTAWTAPAGQSVRSTEFGSSTGHISALLTDSNAPVPSGPEGRLTATASSQSSNGASVSVLLNPAT
jgi:hypothetical protein